MAGGGVTFGGGEPLIQSDFIHEVCKLMPPAWNKRIETSLNVPWRYVEPLLQDLDEWIIDICLKSVNIITALCLRSFGRNWRKLQAMNL